MSRFVMVTDNDGFRYAINVDRIAWICPDSRNVCMSDMNGMEDGLLRLSPEDIQRLLDILGVTENGTD